MRPVTPTSRRTILAALLAFAGCLRQNPDFDGAASAGASEDATGGTTAPTSSLATSTGAEATGTGATTGLQSACPPGFDPAAIGAAEPVDELNSPETEFDMWLSVDGRTMYFASERGGAGSDSYRAVREAPGALFGEVVSNTDLAMNSPEGDTKAALTADGLRYVMSVSEGQAAVLYTATRKTVLNAFDPRILLSPGLQPNAEPGALYFDPHLSDGGERLYAAPNQGGTQRLVVWERVAGAYVAPGLDPFPKVHELPGSAADPTLSADERVLVFGYRAMGAEDTDLWYATRGSPGEVFSAPMPLDALNTADHEGSPHLSHDGCELFFSRSPIDEYDHDIYRAPLGP